MTDVLEDRGAQVVGEQQPVGRGERLLAALAATVLPTWPASSGWVTPEISMVSQSIGTPWQPSAPSTSITCRMRAVVSASRSRSVIAAGPPSLAQLGNIATSVVAPWVYG